MKHSDHNYLDRRIAGRPVISYRLIVFGSDFLD